MSHDIMCCYTSHSVVCNIHLDKLNFKTNYNE